MSDSDHDTSDADSNDDFDVAAMQAQLKKVQHCYLYARAIPIISYHVFPLQALKRSQLREADTAAALASAQRQIATQSIAKKAVSATRSRPSNSRGESPVTTSSIAGSETISSMGSTVSSAGTTSSVDIGKIAKRFGVFNQMFLEHRSWFQEPRPTQSMDTKQRYSSAETIKQGVLIELYNVVPERQHREMQHNGSFGVTVSFFVLNLSRPCSC